MSKARLRTRIVCHGMGNQARSMYLYIDDEAVGYVGKGEGGFKTLAKCWKALDPDVVKAATSLFGDEVVRAEVAMNLMGRTRVKEGVEDDD